MKFLLILLIMMSIFACGSDKGDRKGSKEENPQTLENPQPIENPDKPVGPGTPPEPENPTPPEKDPTTVPLYESALEDPEVEGLPTFLKYCLSTSANELEKNTVNLFKSRLLAHNKPCEEVMAQLNQTESLFLINLSGYKIVDLSPLLEMKQLKSLFMSYVFSDDLSPVFELENLNNLTVRNSSFFEIESLSKLKNLEELALFSSDFTSFKLPQELTKLKKISIENTPLTEFEVANHPNLVDIKVSGFDLKFSVSKTPIKRLEIKSHLGKSDLELKLDSDSQESLQEVKITDFDLGGDSIAFDNLKSLSLSGVNLDELEFGSDSLLETLEIKKSFLNITILSNVSHLKNLDFSSSDINQLFLDNTPLERISLNKVIGDKISIKNHGNLNSFHLFYGQHNSLRIENSPNLSDMILSGTTLTDLTLKKTGVRSLNLHRTALEHVEIANAPLLEGLYLGYNLLSSVKLSKVDSLAVLFLANNQLDSLAFTRGLTSLKRFTVAGNPINKDPLVTENICPITNVADVVKNICVKLINN